MTGSLSITGGGSGLTVAGLTNLNSFVNVNNDLNVSGNLFVDVSSNEVGINTTNPVKLLDVRGDIFLQNALIQQFTLTELLIVITTLILLTWQSEQHQKVLTFIEPEDGTKFNSKYYDDIWCRFTIWC